MKWVSILLLAAALLIGYHDASMAASSPEILAEDLIKAINTKNEDAFRALIHPDNRAYFEKFAHEVLGQRIQKAFRNRIPAGYHIKVIQLKDNLLYHAESQTMTYYWFPNPPDLFLEISYLLGDGSSRVHARNNAIAESGGRWYLVFPINKEKEEKLRIKKRIRGLTPFL